MAGTVNANLTISFSAFAGDDTGTTLEMEVNADDNGDKTSFTFSDTAYYRVYKGSRITSVSYYCSEENVDSQEAASQTAQVEDEVVTFINTAVNNTQYPINSGLTATRMAGTDLGNLGWTVGSSTLEGAQAEDDTDPIVAVYLVTYTTEFELRKITGVSAPTAWPEDESYPILIVAIGTYD